MTVKTARKFRISLNSPVVLGFTAICIVSQLLKLVLSAHTYSAIFSAYRSPFGIMWIVRLFTHVFGHSGWDHLLGNMMYFLILGPMLEEKYGITIDGLDIVPENFSSLDSIAALVIKSGGAA